MPERTHERVPVTAYLPQPGDAFGVGPVPVLCPARRFSLSVPPKPAAVAEVRRTVRQVLGEWGIGRPTGAGEAGRPADDVLVVCGELVTNAVQHARPEIELCVIYGRGRLVVAVTDGSGAGPGVRSGGGDPGDPEGLCERGRGLGLVHALSRHRGWVATGRGKTVWAELAVRRAEVAGLGRD